jgi:hypothetical protein
MLHLLLVTGNLNPNCVLSFVKAIISSEATLVRQFWPVGLCFLTVCTVRHGPTSLDLQPSYPVPCQCVLASLARVFWFGARVVVDEHEFVFFGLF